MVDKSGRAASYTGEDCYDWAGHVVGESFACQSNILIPGTVEAMAEAFESAGGRLVATLELGRTLHPFRVDDADDLAEFAAQIALRLG